MKGDTLYNLPESLLNSIKQQIDEALAKENSHPIAAFDADGTLWSMDMGEAFFKYTVENSLVNNLPESPWEYYLELHNRDPLAGYLWLATIYDGHRLEQVREWSTASINAIDEIGLFECQKQIISYLQKKQVEVFIVTASIQWAVEPAAKFFNVPTENVMGVKSKVSNGIISCNQDGPITSKQGKVDGLLKRTGNKKPFFVAGNTFSDLPLLESSSHIRLVLNSAPKGHHLYEVEVKMQEIAKKHGWNYHSFINSPL